MGGASHGTSHGRHRAGRHHGAHAGIVQAGIVHACVARQVAVAGGGALAEPKPAVAVLWSPGEGHCLFQTPPFIQARSPNRQHDSFDASSERLDLP